MGDHPLENQSVIHDFEKFTRDQINTMNGFPAKEYHFLIQSLDYKHYHGVEHQNSTVLVLGPNKEENKEAYFEKLMGVASHELFHTWNVTRIRPKEMSPYHYADEINFETGFVAEGFTTYYGDYFLKTSGVFSEEQYFKELNTLFKRHFENYGRFNSSLIESSRNLWANGYKIKVPSEKVSIYVKGAISSLILDLNIRKETNHKSTLIDVIQELYEKHTFEKGGYSKSDVFKVFQKIAGENILDLAKSLIEGRAPIELYLKEALDFVGCEILKKNHENHFTSFTGAKLIDAKVVEIAPNSPAEKLLSIDDEILNPKIEVLKDLVLKDYKIRLTILRRSKKLGITIPIQKKTYFDTFVIQTLKNVNDEQLINKRMWLKH
jgi:predicted metalloprotease with PDZ domain